MSNAEGKRPATSLEVEDQGSCPSAVACAQAARALFGLVGLRAHVRGRALCERVGVRARERTACDLRWCLLAPM